MIFGRVISGGKYPARTSLTISNFPPTLLSVEDVYVIFYQLMIFYASDKK